MFASIQNTAIGAFAVFTNVLGYFTGTLMWSAVGTLLFLLLLFIPLMLDMLFTPIEGEPWDYSMYDRSVFAPPKKQ